MLYILILQLWSGNQFGIAASPVIYHNLDSCEQAGKLWERSNSNNNKYYCTAAPKEPRYSY